MNDTLDNLRADFPGYTIDTEARTGDDPTRYIAVRREPGPGPHTVVTPDPAELRVELATGRSPAAPTTTKKTTRSASTPPSPTAHPTPSPPSSTTPAPQVPPSAPAPVRRAH